MTKHRITATSAACLLTVAVVAAGWRTTHPAASDPDHDLHPAGHHRPGDRFDTSNPMIGNLDPDLLAAVEDAADDARKDGVALQITSGWRSRAHQQELLDAAVAKYGSEEAARRFVSTPDASAHVTGDAVDIGPTEADDWLGRHGAAYGLCQVFANEIWHFELATTPGGQCPEMYPDSSYRQ
ncbi:M15 family metallopeptidase [Nocardioides sp. CN2-186]|uniref:M15 family metallopeptidase n=1 Tax=Nocardioides tweenelious TaxID=3156607 RepID=UPI0032B508F4